MEKIKKLMLGTRLSIEKEYLEFGELPIRTQLYYHCICVALYRRWKL